MSQIQTDSSYCPSCEVQMYGDVSTDQASYDLPTEEFRHCPMCGAELQAR